MNKKQKQAIEDLDTLWDIAHKATTSQPGEAWATAHICRTLLGVYIEESMPTKEEPYRPSQEQAVRNLEKLFEIVNYYTLGEEAWDIALRCYKRLHEYITEAPAWEEPAEAVCDRLRTTPSGKEQMLEDLEQLHDPSGLYTGYEPVETAYNSLKRAIENLKECEEPAETSEPAEAETSVTFVSWSDLALTRPEELFNKRLNSVDDYNEWLANGGKADDREIVIDVEKMPYAASLPTKGTERSVGYDLACLWWFSTDSECSRWTGRTQLRMRFPENLSHADIRPRSSALRKGARVQYGTIDQDYRGEILIAAEMMDPDADMPLDVAQMVFFLTNGSPVSKVRWNVVESINTDTERGEGGFGSTDS